VAAPERERRTSFGQAAQPTQVDRFGVWLTQRRVSKYVSFADKRVGDFGCGYEAKLVRQVLPNVKQVVLLDVALAEDLKHHPKIWAMEGRIPEALSAIKSGSLDVVLCLSVLEHLWSPVDALKEFSRVLVSGGTCLINVPTWRGKRFLEFSAFKLGLSPSDEMDDHKTYYDPGDLWPLLVRAGFVPHNIRCFRHKFGLNTFAICLKE
jgi:SAM-dependent methyltransferase